MIGAIQKLVRTTDSAIVRLYLSLFREQSAVLSFLFHSLFKDENEIAQNVIDPLEKTTVSQFRQLIQYYLRYGYRFITPDDVIAGLDPHGKYALLTFDDGYYNNLRALPVLEEFGVPATFFISTNHIQQNKCFWWDVLHRERTAAGISQRDVHREIVAMKSMKAEEIEADLIARFGAQAFVPRGEVDRPFTPTELRAFGSNPLVHLGNHTANHAILTNYTDAEVRQQIGTAQEALREMTGHTATSIAYPNGAQSPEILRASRDLGLQIGFTTRPGKIALPVDGKSLDTLRLDRFVPHADAPMESQCRTYRSDLLLYAKFRSGYLKMARGQVTS